MIRYRIAVELYGLAVKIGGEPFKYALRQALLAGVYAEQQAARRAATEQQVRILQAHQRNVANIARSN